jgi:Holliday junction resolvase-like predicted endonuclease
MKPFSQELYDADDHAKDLVIRWLKDHGWSLEVNPDPYGIDLIGFDPHDKFVTIEVEVKHNWTTNRFPYDKAHVSARKQKYIQPGMYLVMLNHARTHAISFDHDELAHAKLITKDTIYTKGEQFMELMAGEVAVIR